MEIDFNSLSFKLQPPSQPVPLPASKIKLKDYLGFDETQASQCEEEATNPFRRTFHLFKHVQKSKSPSEDNSQRTSKTSYPPQLADTSYRAQAVTYSLENFDSFKNFDSKAETLESKEHPHLYKQSQYIKIESQHSQEMSLIIDDLDHEIQGQDLIADAPRRIKTDYDEPRDHKKKKDKGGFFCLTAQEESESTVKEFYFDLREEQSRVKLLEKEAIKGVKDQVKSLIYDFVDDLEMMEEGQIDPEFLFRLTNCLVTVRKIPQLPPPSGKWDKSNRKSPVRKGHSEVCNPSSKPQLSMRFTNKENIPQPQKKMVESKARRETGRRKWAL